MLKKLAASVLLGSLVSAPAVAADKEPIRIGTFVSATGPASFLGDPQAKTLQLFIEQINQKGGVLGRPLQLIHYDDQGQAEQARTLARRLIAQDKADVLIAGSTTGAIMAAVPLIERTEIPLITMAGAVVVVEPVKKWVFKTPETDRMAAEKIFADMKRRGISKIGLISGTGGFGASGRKESLAVVGNYGIEVVADETYAPTDTDMSAQLTRIRNTPGVQAILNFDFGQAPAIVTRNYASLGIKQPLYQSHGVASNAFLELAGSAAEGVRLPVSPILVAKLLPENDRQKGPAMAYGEAYEKRFGEWPSAFGAYAYDALMLMTDAIERAGSLDRAKIRDAIEATKNFHGATGNFNMTPEDHMGLSLESSFRMVEVRNGTWKLIED
jgi:branched-chain amino acid transport system substrate-binding protein